MTSLNFLLLAFTLSNSIISWPAGAFAQTTLTPVNVPIEGPPAGFNAALVPDSSSAGEPVLESFVSFSIETAFFPDFAGNTGAPNNFSRNLLEELREFQGSLPNVRVGGNTQDYALFDSTLQAATRGIYSDASKDYPTTLAIGRSYFESYQTWPGVKFIHGFNLAKNESVAAKILVDPVSDICKALSDGKLLYWEMGNEPDLYKTSAQGVVRPKSWSEADYVTEWSDKVESIKEALKSECGNAWTSEQKFKWIAPSFAGTKNSLDSVKSWNAGLDKAGVIVKFSSHNYIGGATQPGVTLRGTLMNHTKTVASIAAHNAEQKALSSAGMELDYILGETNSLYNQGAPGLSNSFGAAIWGVDFNLMAAATNIKQVFMHQGTDYRYASWQPISTSKTSIGTKPPYYGNIAVAAALGDVTNSSVRVANIPLNQSTEAAYAIYSDNILSRLMIINMNEYNYSVPTPSPRPVPSYNFTVPATCKGSGVVQRLIANGSDAISGISFNGMSWNFELDGGKGKLLGNATRNEIVWVASDGDVSVQVPDSSAALVQLTC
ncbi:glycoside hydrolase family 79 protein [Lentithecium fluviatile CBS 122367]|uniref:Glycoside hydrolase family 79 protein n=1 Tax=Lentithecium fluviatile CBS 122367 TaxID=1168545 RepID=A0A6G1J2G8_9PLEO|nr:glycoside hydrolase family 79 protein [Lentithecium fluviatile CBS 122367]